MHQADKTSLTIALSTTAFGLSIANTVNKFPTSNFVTTSVRYIAFVPREPGQFLALCWLRGMVRLATLFELRYQICYNNLSRTMSFILQSKSIQ